MGKRLVGLAALFVLVACSASSSVLNDDGAGGAGADGPSGDDGSSLPSGCNQCNLLGGSYVSCDAQGNKTTVTCDAGCTNGIGCTACPGGGNACVGNEVHACNADGSVGDLVRACDVGTVCANGTCGTPCDVSAEQPSNVGCEFWAADLDMSDITQVAHQPWGLVIANAGDVPADVTIENNDAPVGMPPHPVLINSGTLQPGQLGELDPPKLFLDCGKDLDDHDAPGTCLSSNAIHITSTAPVVVYQFNNINHAYSTDASLLLPTTAIGQSYRVMGWPAAHSAPEPGIWVERSYVTIIGTKPNTHVTVHPGWNVVGNGALAATPTGGTMTATIGPFDVLNLESDAATLAQEIQAQKAPFPADMTGTTVESDQPVVVFSGTESSGVGVPAGAPLSPQCQTTSGSDPGDDGGAQGCGCCLQHLEEQLAPLEALGKTYVVTRSPIRSTDGYVEPDVIRFLGGAEASHVTTTLPAPFDAFDLQPGQILDTWTQTDFIAQGTAPFEIAQLLVAGSYVSPDEVGDPSFTIFETVEQAQSAYVFLSPNGWDAYVVISTPATNTVNVDGSPPDDCVVAPAGNLNGVDYEARRCKIANGVHQLTGDQPFGIMAYGFSDADAYAFPGGAFFKKIYAPPPLH